MDWIVLEKSGGFVRVGPKGKGVIGDGRKGLEVRAYSVSPERYKALKKGDDIPEAALDGLPDEPYSGGDARVVYVVPGSSKVHRIGGFESVKSFDDWVGNFLLEDED